MKMVHMVAWILVIVGGLNWGLAALGWNVVDMIFGASSSISMLVYLLVGLSAVYELATQWKGVFGQSSGGAMM